MKVKTKSPLKSKPLRYVAQSADEAIDDLLNEKISFFLISIIFLSYVIFQEWYRFYNPVSQPPVFATVILGLMILLCLYLAVKNFLKLKHMKLGRDGERAVGQYLEELRESGCRVYHDIVGDRFNVDHVLISEKGIYVIETKTYSKPAFGNPVISYDGESIKINGHDTVSDIIVQAKAAANHIKGILKESTGNEYEPFPVILFPGWFIDGKGNRDGKLWVLEPKAFKKFFEAQPNKLKPESVNLVSYHLSRHIRTHLN